MHSKFAVAEIFVMVHSEGSLPRKNRPHGKRLDRSRGKKSIHRQEGNENGNTRKQWKQTLDSEFMRPV